MANPVFPVAVPNGVWTKVATNVLNGQVWRKNSTPKYFMTYRDTGEVAPVNVAEGVAVFVDEISMAISSTVEIDVYLFARGEDGEVRVDL